MIDYKTTLNAPQYEAVTSTDHALLVVAGAGSGKTRTIIYRLAWLVEQGISPSSMLLLTFTRKAAREMLGRANQLLSRSLHGIHGGTFHSFAFRTLKTWHPDWLGTRNLTLLDANDIQSALKLCKNNLKLDIKDRSFPKIQTIQAIISKSRNTEQSIRDVLAKDSYQLLPFADDLEELSKSYTELRHAQGLLDYDDLLFELERLLRTNTVARNVLRDNFQYVMVDEYQDTNPVQARIIQLLGMPDNKHNNGHVMAVGDEAQSIYSFRGATIQNILDFPQIFPDTKIIRLEENYRSTRAVLRVANTILKNSAESFNKVLFTAQKGGAPVYFYTPTDEQRQAMMIVSEIDHLLSVYPPEEIAVLFRSGFHSYLVELALNTQHIPFQKYGGLKYSEAAHIKDCLAFARLVVNPFDMPAFSRIAAMHKGIGPKTIQSLFAERTANPEKFAKHIHIKYPDFEEDLRFIDSMNAPSLAASSIISSVVDYYEPRLQKNYLDDWPSRKQGLEEMAVMAATYTDLDEFIADLVLESPEEGELNPQNKIVLSTIHSAKGLEWDAVLLIDLVDNRFPSHHAYSHPEDLEEERRLMYVACTRARKELHLYAPQTIYNRSNGFSIETNISPFVEELRVLQQNTFVSCQNKLRSHNITYPEFDDEDFVEAHEPSCEKSVKEDEPKAGDTCYHKIFGTGRIVRFPDKRTVQVNFSQYGIKTIVRDYISF